jgi:hypothetical protein
MHQVAEQVLIDVLQKYGCSACDTPQLLETVLRKYGRACSHEVEILIAALRGGVVIDLRADHAADRSALARVLAIQARMPQGQAEWAVKAWSTALSTAPSRVSAIWPPPDVSQPQSLSAIRMAGVLALAAVTGIIACLTILR